MGRISLDRDTAGSGGASAPSWEDLTAVTINADTNNWNPATDTTGWRVGMAGNDHDLTGIVAPSGGVQKNYWIFINDTQKLKLKHNNANSAANNRFYLPDESDYEIKGYGVVAISYNPLINKWMLAGGEGKS